MIPANTNFPERIITALGVTFPELGPIESITVMREGFRNIVLETSSGDVFKIAKNWEASATFAKERQILPLLDTSLSAPIPFPIWHDGRSSHFPFGVLGYPKLPGVPIEPSAVSRDHLNTLAKDVAGFILSMHRAYLDDTTMKHLPGPDLFWHQLSRTPSAILPVLRELLLDGDYETVESWWHRSLTDRRMRNMQPVLQHGDLVHDNILVDESSGSVSGIVDFENLALGDPAQDFAAQLHMGGEFTEAVLRHYQTAGGILDSDVRYRIQKLWELRGFDGMQLAVHFEDQGAFDASLTGLLNGPIFNETTRRDTTIWQPPRN